MATEHSSRIEIERYFTGDLPASDAERVGRHIAECAECGAAFSELEAEKIRFLNVYPYEEFAQKRRLVRRRSLADRVSELFRTPWTFQLYGGAAAVTALLIMMIPLYMIMKKYGDAETEAEYRYKGVSGVSFLYMRDGEMGRGSPGDVFREGDRLQFFYSHGLNHHAVLFSIDNSGAISFYTGDGADGGEPGGGDSADRAKRVCSVPAEPGSGLTFPSSVVLDGSRGEELVVMLVSGSPVTAGEVTKWVRRLSGDDYSNLSGIEKALLRKRLNSQTAVSSVRIGKE